LVKGENEFEATHCYDNERDTLPTRTQMRGARFELEIDRGNACRISARLWYLYEGFSRSIMRNILIITMHNYAYKVISNISSASSAPWPGKIERFKLCRTSLRFSAGVALACLRDQYHWYVLAASNPRYLKVWIRLGI
jgi:hypothetical protein